MKRKFSFNLPPVKVPTNHTKQTPEPTPSRAQSHRRQYSKDSISSLNSPFISRRPLSPKTEQELRAACAVILQNFKPSDHDFVDTDPKLDFQGLDRRREHRSERTTASQVKAQKPTGAPTEPRSSHDARKQSRKPDSTVKAYPDLPMQANTGRRRTEQGSTIDKEQDTRRIVKSPSSDLPRSATMRTDVDSDDGKSLGTPLTTSTDHHQNNGSTAPTSAALTSSRSSKRASRQFENAAAVADAQAAEWMRQELEKRRQQTASQPQSEPQAPAQPPSRTRSIKSQVQEYIFPGSTNLSRTQSRESMRTTSSQTSLQKELKRSTSSHGWRSWGLQRKSSSRSNSRPGTSKGRIEYQEQDKKTELNLNRELPPLPSLDSWQKSEGLKSKENRKSQLPGAHIASVMRPHDQQQQQYAAAVRKHHRRSGSDTLALRYANSAYSHASAQAARTTSHGKPHPQSGPTQKRRTRGLDSSLDFDEMMSAMSPPRNLDDQLALRFDTPDPPRSKSAVSRSPSMKNGEGRLNPAPNFSRKISTDVSGAQRHDHHEYAYPNMVQLPSTPKDEQKSKLKKVLSGWMLRKEKKEDWMHRIEKEGVKGGVMIQDEAALPPVVRY